MSARVLTGPRRPAEAPLADGDGDPVVCRLRRATPLEGPFIPLAPGSGLAVTGLALPSDARHTFTDMSGLGMAGPGARRARPAPSAAHPPRGGGASAVNGGLRPGGPAAAAPPG
jgi:hypothetical protein